MAVAWWKRNDAPTGPVGAATALIASAERLVHKTGPVQRHRGAQAELHREAWRHYKATGELRYVVRTIANAVSRAQLMVCEVGDDGRPTGTPVDGGAALFGGVAAQQEILREIAVHLQVPGETYLVGESVDGGEAWQVASTQELNVKAGRLSLDTGDGARDLDPATTVVVRIWVPDPEKHSEATSQVEGALRPLRILERLADYGDAELDSRLKSGGLLLAPSEMEIAYASQEDAAGDDGRGGPNSLLRALTEAMTTAVSDRDSPAAIVPIVLQGPGEHLDKVRLLHFDTPLSEVALERENAAIRRLALSLDAPPERLLGMGTNTNHWSVAWLGEDEVAYHVIPLLEIICAALTSEFLRPALTGQVDDPRRYVVWYDASALTQRPDRSGTARDVFDRGELSADALRRESGFKSTDAPAPHERELRGLTELMSNVPETAPVVLPRVLELLGVRDVITVEPADPTAPALPLRVGVPKTPVQKPPVAVTASAGGPSAGFLAACDALAVRALEVAGKRLVGRGRHKLAHLEAWEYHTVGEYGPITPATATRLLDGAWVLAPSVAARLGVEAAPLTACLTSYVGERLTTGARHDPDALAEHVTTHLTGDTP